ncbi:DoxX family membrane protein [Nocardioides sp.]|uniref:DoxX family membrane protein n=1 Tax=Nocardioides sp. TaxID=35761 RepID=UPI0039E5BFB9
MTISRLVARPLLSSIFVVGPAKALKDPEGPAKRADWLLDRVVTPVRRAALRTGIALPEEPTFWVRVNAGVQLAAALALATGRAPRTSAAVLAGTLVPTTLAGHAFWRETDPAARSQQQLQFAKNLSVLGGLVIAAWDTEDRPGVRWRLRHAALDARRAARQEVRVARKEAKVLALQARQAIQR